MNNLLTETRNKVLYVTLNRPDKLNAFSDELWYEFSDTLDKFVEMDSWNVMVIKGAGKSFSAGWDVSPRKVPLVTISDWRWRADMINKVMYKVWDSPKPIIAQIHGYCLGGACDLAMVCDITISAKSAIFGEPEVLFNSHPPFEIMPWVLGLKYSKEYLLTGDKFDANEAQRIGLINRCVDDSELEEYVDNLALKISRLPPSTVMMNKYSINRTFEAMGFRTAITMGGEAFAEVLSNVTPESRKFNHLKETQGMKAAFKWRDAYYSGDPAATLDIEE